MTVYPPGEVLTWAAILFAVMCLVWVSTLARWFKFFLVFLLAFPLGFTLRVVWLVMVELYY